MQALNRRLIHGPRLRVWWALEQQRRRRARLAAAVSVPPMLDSGLLQFYRPIEGALCVASFDETIVLGDAPYSGMAGVELLDGSGSYPANTEIRYFLLPYRLIDGGRIYHGLTTYFMTATTQDDDAVAMQEWSGTPTGVDGFTVVRWVNTASLSYRHYTTAQMAAGWTDTGNGWTAGLPWNYASPMVTAKVMWSRFNHWLPQAMVTTASPFGGVAFDSGLNQQWVRELSDDVRRLTDCTMAFWYCPVVASGQAWAVRGILTEMFGGNMSGGEGEFTMGTNLDLLVTNHTEDDWYLVVHRNDTLEGLQKLTAIRLGTGSRYDATTDSLGTSLTAESDYFLEGMYGAVALGSSWHWNVGSNGLYDRLGLWERSLSDVEIEDLFNLGLGWLPGS